MGYFFFILVTAILFIRPSDFIPVLESVQLYLIMIVACLLTSATVVFEQLTSDSMQKRPISACVIGLGIATVLSNLANARIEGILSDSIEFVKMALFYLLLVGLANSRSRLRCYLLSVAGILMVPVGLAVLHHQGYIHLQAFVLIDPWTGMPARDDGRLRGTGMFGDPNDLCLLINVGMMLSLYGILGTKSRFKSLFWLGPLALFIQALKLTESRGGFLAALASVGVLLFARFGIRKGLLLALVALPVIFSQFGGRQVQFDMDNGQDTGMLRIQMWSSAMELFRHAPVFGIGTNQSQAYLGRAVHNSFIQSYVDMGFFGGTLLVGAYYHAYRRMFQLKMRPGPGTDAELASMWPYIVGAMTGYAITMTSTNHTYGVATYGILGMAAALIRLADADRPPAGELLDNAMVARLIKVSLVFLIANEVYIRASLHY